MNVTMTSEEICELIQANKERVKYLIKSKKIGEEIEMHGYRLLCMYKLGRNNIYELEPCESDEWTIYQACKKVKKKNEHTDYVENRLTNGMKESRRKLVKSLNINISETTAKRYDEILLEDEVMKKDRVVYLMFNPNTETLKEISKDEYNIFWSDLGELGKQLSINKRRYNSGEINETTYDNNKTIFMTTLGKEKGEIALKYDTYKEYTNTLRVLEMIKKHRNKNKGKKDCI